MKRIPGMPTGRERRWLAFETSGQCPTALTLPLPTATARDMMHTSSDGKRMYVTNSLLSTLDHSGRFYVRLVHVGPDGMKVDPFFNIDLNTFPTGTARGHDMLLN